jgi:threonine dehydratase
LGDQHEFAFVLKLVGSSGGNAGLAMAFAAKMLSMPIVLFIPTSTPPMMVERIKVGNFV